jgi:DNA ligase-associated metallophosphoesterase
MAYPLQINHRQFELHPSGVLYWKEHNALFVSDVHLGKVSHFRKHGSAVPREAIDGNFELLDACTDEYEPATIYFLGDLFHSYMNSEWMQFESWVGGLGCRITLVAGNHDIISPLKYEAIGIEVVPEVIIDGFLFTHHPQVREGFFSVAGHVHPAVRLHGQGRQSLRLPCFFKSESQLILPAFGSFTGMHTLKKKKGNEIYAIADAEVIKI